MFKEKKQKLMQLSVLDNVFEKYKILDSIIANMNGDRKQLDFLIDGFFFVFVLNDPFIRNALICLHEESRHYID